MSFETTQEATIATLNILNEFIHDIRILEDAAKSSLAAFNLTQDTPAEVSSTTVSLTAGPIGIHVTLDQECGTQITVEVVRLRNSEALHPEAPTAILAELMSLLAEEFEATEVIWTPAGLTIPADRFVKAFTPLRRRGGSDRVCPRRVRRDDTTGTPILTHIPQARQIAPVPGDDATRELLRTVFAQETESTQPERSNLTNVSAWAATASVGAMAPVIGVPLAAYNLTRGADIRVSTHAFALTATLSGVLGSTLGHLPFF